MLRLNGITFYRDELRDLAVAWVALGFAFAMFLEPATIQRMLGGAGHFGRTFLLSMLTVGVGFLLHELAHKIVAVQFGQVAAFRADYGMLALAVAGALAGIFFAAPGAVYHRGRITTRQNGLIAVAGPVTNLALAVVFLLPFLLFGGFVGEVSQMGVLVNLFLGAFNMIPFGPLDGKTVREWDTGIFALVLVTAVGSLVGFLLGFGFGL
ncbi:metalloprotease [Halovenus sp. WSH3]|uniref:Metalloprotease n=1 Tax=Halovenus carboxidivorans TaxID=2692199 RepID=A0A6B0T9R5_9EURY|nr:metalloprotease [Halovenus carboxidivorans]MXR51610.1 metalloprotease [Halovenus carboxidivorans]